MWLITVLVFLLKLIIAWPLLLVLWIAICVFIWPAFVVRSALLLSIVMLRAGLFGGDASSAATIFQRALIFPLEGIVTLTRLLFTSHAGATEGPAGSWPLLLLESLWALILWAITLTIILMFYPDFLPVVWLGEKLRTLWHVLQERIQVFGSQSKG
jgi:hypothetical protein